MKRKQFFIIIIFTTIFLGSFTQTMEETSQSNYAFWKEKSKTRASELTSQLTQKTEIGFYIANNQIVSEQFNDFPGSPITSPRIGSSRHAFVEGIRPRQPIVSLYKIHLMPRDEDLEKATIALSTLIQSNPELKNAINVFKIIPMYEQFQKILEERGEESAQAPKIVIYTTDKQNAQTVLNKMYKHFKNWPGVGRAPSFNEKVTDFIFFAQGDRGDKINYPDLFEESGVYFKPDIVKGRILDFHLINPAQQ